MSIFGNLARFYDTVYADKDYAAEATYVIKLLDMHSHDCKHLLELGSGTGRHAIELARASRHVVGIDASHDMVTLANERLSRHHLEGVSFLTADATRYRGALLFDAVIACFHVLNYMATPRALIDAFSTAAAHLPKGGLFLFDSWHGPAVRASGPDTRVRDLRAESMDIVRIAQPKHDPEHQTVDVRYRFFTRQPPTTEWHLIEETHHLRYLFRNDVIDACEKTGFELILDEEWLSGKPLNEATWNACYLARRT
ncbi:class I SAM-dependent DNA methyltransferase [Dyella subtropica]|uniref:class I SAM-dependent DNA methyltransferase n=1 Tax=Dyella subtropica TaxID=2992127 RepID=UPI00224DC8EB|nr:class I SAM-dependent methyltransferase [Dyella subtropica]